MHVEIVDRQAVVWAGETSQITVPAHDGAMGILPGHTPLMALLVPGRVEVALDSQTMVYEVQSGFVTVDNDNVFVVVEDSDAGRAQN